MMTRTDRQLQRTLRPGALRDEATIPALGSPARAQTARPGPCAVGDVIDGMTILQPAGEGNQSFSYLAQLRDGSKAMLKLYEPEKVLDPVARNRMARLRCSSLVPIRSVGTWEGHPYECLQIIHGEPLTAQLPMTEEQVFTRVIPAVVQAMQALHTMGLLHNDIKPENLFMEHQSGQVFLMDYGNVTGQEYPRDIGGTPVYMSPETLFSGGRIRSTASDYCAFGLTLVTLLTGMPLFEGKDLKQLRMVWQRNLVMPHTLSPQAQLLCNGLIGVSPERRWKFAQVERWMQTNGLEMQTAVPGRRDSNPRVRAPRTQLRFAGEWIYDIEELIEAIRKDWDTGVFMLCEHRLEPFLMQFSQDYYNLCQQCTEIFDRNEALFRLIQELRPSEEIIWCGRTFRDLSDMISCAEREPELENSYLMRFCRANLLRFYMEKNGANEAQLEYTRRLEELSRRNPELAFQRLKLSMEEVPTCVFRGQTLRSREDLYELLAYAGAGLDSIVGELCDSQKFEAWLDFQQLGGVIPRVRAEMEAFR